MPLGANSVLLSHVCFDKLQEMYMDSLEKSFFYEGKFDFVE